MNKYSYYKYISIVIQYDIISTMPLNKLKIYLRYLVKCLEIKLFYSDIFQWNTNFSDKDSNNWDYYKYWIYFENFNGKNKYKETTSNIQDVCVMKHPSILWTFAQMEEITRED